MRTIDLNHLSFVQFLDFFLHEYALSCYFLPRAGHAEHPGDPLQENHVNLNIKCVKSFLCHKKILLLR